MPTTVIVGGGIMGSSAAFFLSLCENQKVIVIERDKVACAASGKAGGFLAKNWGNTFTQEFHEKSYKMHEELSEEFGLTTYRKGLPVLQVSQSLKKSAASTVTWLNGDRLGSMMDSSCAQVTPAELTNKFMEKAKENGAKLIIGTVTGVSTCEETKGKIKGVYISKKDDGGGAKLLEGDNVLFTLGPWSCLLENFFPGFRVPVEGIKSTSVEIGKMDPLLKEPYALFCEDDENNCHLELYPRPDGSLYICGLGGSLTIKEKQLLPGGDNNCPSQILPNENRVDKCINSLCCMSPLLFPDKDRLKEKITKTQACMRPLTEDGLPMIGPIPNTTNGYICAGHNCWGILWGPISGKCMSELIIEGKSTSANLKYFNPGRF